MNNERMYTVSPYTVRNPQQTHQLKSGWCPLKTLSSCARNALSFPDTGEIIPLVLLKEQREDSSDGEPRMALVGPVHFMVFSVWSRPSDTEPGCAESCIQAEEDAHCT